MKKFIFGFVGFMIFLFIFVAEKVYSQQKNFDNVSFSLSQGQLAFFDKNSGEVFVYGTASGKIQQQWKITDLGSDLKKVDEVNSLWEKNKGI